MWTIKISQLKIKSKKMMTRKKHDSRNNKCQSLEEDLLPYHAILFVVVVVVAVEDVDLCLDAILGSADFISFYLKSNNFYGKTYQSYIFIQAI